MYEKNRCHVILKYGVISGMKYDSRKQIWGYRIPKLPLLQLGDTMREKILVILSCTVLCILVIVIIYRKFLLPAKIQKKLFQNNVFDNITNNTDMMVLVYYPLKHRVEFVSDSVGWLFGLDKFRVSRNIYYLFDKLNIPAEDEIVKGFCNGSSMLSAQKEYEFESPEIHEKRWIRLRTVPCDKGRYVLIVMDTTLEHEDRDTLITALKAVDQMRRINQNLIMTLQQDILNPINGIGEMMPMAQINIEDSVRVNECLAQLAVSYKELIERMSEVTDVSKGDSTVEQMEFDLPELLQEIGGSVEWQILQKKHTFQIYTDLKHENVVGDRRKIKRVIVNLLNNAIRYTQFGGNITLSVGETPVWCGSSEFKFVVEDNGIGIEKEFLSKVFEPFERADDIRVQRVQGIGLGMVVVKNILDLLEGKIDVETEPGHGSRFTVTLQMKVCSEEEDEVQDKNFRG